MSIVSVMNDRKQNFSYLKGLAEIDAAYGHIRISFPRTHHRFKRFYLWIWASLIAVQPHTRTAVALILHLASVWALAPAAAVLGRQGQTHAAVVRHVATSVYHQMYIVRIIQGFGAAPDHGERYRNIRCTRRIRELRFFTIDRVSQQTRVDARDAALDVKLTHEACLYDELLKEILSLRKELKKSRNFLKNYKTFEKNRKKKESYINQKRKKL